MSHILARIFDEEPMLPGEGHVDFLSSGTGTAQIIFNFASVGPEPASALLGSELMLVVRRRFSDLLTKDSVTIDFKALFNREWTKGASPKVAKISSTGTEVCCF